MYYSKAQLEQYNAKQKHLMQKSVRSLGSSSMYKQALTSTEAKLFIKNPIG